MHNCITRAALVAALLWLGFSAAQAAPSLQGSTGLLGTPSADALPQGTWSAGYYRHRGANDAVMTAGLGGGLEASVRRRDALGEPPWQWNLKWALAPEQVLKPGLALGVDDLAGREQRSVYLAASKALPYGMRLHLGLGNGRFHGAFGALEAPVLPRTWLILEQDGRRWNAGARLALGPEVRLDAGRCGGHTYLGASYTY